MIKNSEFGYCDDIAKKLEQELINKGIVELSEKILDKMKVKLVKSTFRLRTKNKLFSPKFYEAKLHKSGYFGGWGGGSKGHIKTYKFS